MAAVAALIAFLLFPAQAALAEPSRTSVEQELDRLAHDISNLDEEFNLARIELAKTEAKVRDAEQRKARADESLAQLKRRASARGVAIYRAGLPNVVLTLLSAKSTGDFRRRIGMISLVANWEVKLVDSLQLAQARSDEISEQLRRELVKRRSVRDSIASKRRSIEAKIAQQNTILAKMDAAALRTRRAPAPPPIDFAALPTSPNARIAVQTAYAQIGKSYRYGASGPDSFDCSGLTMYSWGKAGVGLPHSSRAQYSATKRVARSNLQPGDLVFFGRPIHHVGIYIGNGNMINAPETGELVGIRSMNRHDYAGAGRPGV